MAEKKTILVWGATGAQGGSVVSHLLASGLFNVRGATRNKDSDAAKALAEKGVEIVQANQHSAEDIAKANAGAYGVFAVTNFWDPESMGQEVDLGRALIKGAVDAGVKHFVWSTLPDAGAISGGKFTGIKHFDEKAQVDALVAGAGFEYTTFFRAGFYMENFQTFFPPKAAEDGTLVFSLPIPADGKLDMYSARADTGGYVLEIFKHPETHGNGAVIDSIGETITPAALVEQFSKTTGKPARFEPIDAKAFAKFGFPGAEELAEMFEYFYEFRYLGGEPLNHIYKDSLTWAQWIERSGLSG